MKRLVFSLFVLILAAACGEGGPGTVGFGNGTPEPVVPQEPRVLAVGQSALVIGEPINFYGDHFLDADLGQTKLVFSGKFKPDGSDLPLSVNEFSIAPLYDGYFPAGASVNGEDLAPMTTSLRWNRFGPFQNPFTKEGNQPGTFEGTIQAVNFYHDGTIMDGDPKPVTLTVGPSLIITKLEPIIGADENGIKTANCGSPALRGIGGLAYVLEVEAIGFEPEYFIYNLSNINGQEQFTSYTHQANGNMVDRLGDPSWHADEIVVLNTVENEAEYSLAAIRVTAVDKDNNAYHTALPLSVVRSMHFYYDGNRELAEYYEPKVVHPGSVGEIGTVITYTESHAESRQNAVSVNISNSWSKSQNKSETANWNEGVSQTSSVSSSNSVGQSHSEGESSGETYGTTYGSSNSQNSSFSSSEGSKWGWNAVDGTTQEEYDQKLIGVFGSVSGSVSTTVTAEGSVPGFAKVGGSVGTSVGAEAGAKTDTTVGNKTGSKSEHGTHMHESADKTTAFGSTTTDSSSKSVSGTYGLQKQSSINQQTTQTEANSESTTYSMGGSVGLTEGVSEGSTESWSETWVTSNTDMTIFSYSSKVPHGWCAVTYRQTVRYVRRAQIYTYNLCGVRSLAGEANFNEWLWSPNIATAATCDQAKSSQPAAKCFLACE